MMRMGSNGKSKSKRIETSKSMDPSTPRSSDSSRKPNFISRLASMGSLKSLKRSKSTEPSPLPAAASQPHSLIQMVEVAELEMAFKVFDANGDGQICISELGTLLRSLGGEVTQEELELIMHDCDKDRDGFISLEEFKEVHESFGGSGGDDPVRQAFATFDKDGNNLICPDELRAVLRSLGEKGHSLEDCRRMISCVDQNGDGFVDFHEFQNLLSARS